MSEAEAVNDSPEGMTGLVDDWSADRQAYQVPWGKAMMWIFLVSDTFIFSCFFGGYLNVRLTTTAPWPPKAKSLPCLSVVPDTAYPDSHHDVHTDHELWNDGAGG